VKKFHRGHENKNMERRERKTNIFQGDGVRSYFDPKFGVTAYKVLPGEHFVTGSKDAMLVTVLGSCVSACIRDPVTGVGGMNHFMFPEIAEEAWSEVGAARRYGNYLMERLINDILKQGGKRDRLEVKIFGGANVIKSSFHIGDDNVNFVREYLHKEKMSIESEDVGKTYPRRVHYFPTTGKAYRLFLRRSDDSSIFNEELRMRKKKEIVHEEAGGIELFDEDV